MTSPVRTSEIDFVEGLNRAEVLRYAFEFE